MKGVRLVAVTGHLPTGTVTNADLMARGLDTSDEWIVSRTGIRSRRAAAPDESVVDMGAVAAGKALASAGVAGGDVDLLILASCTLIHPIPGGAAAVADRIGSFHAGAFNLNAGCAGSSYALASGADAIRSGTAEVVVVAAAERMTDWIDPMDRSTAIIFGDGAGAFVLVADDDPERQDVGPVTWGNKGSAGAAIGVSDDTHKVFMDGPAVYRWATTELAPVVHRACHKAGVAISDLAGFVPHQANLRIIDHLTRSLGIDENRTVVSRHIEHTGNTSAASIPLALADLLDAGRLPTGSPVLVMGYGAGLSYAAQVIRVP